MMRPSRSTLAVVLLTLTVLASPVAASVGTVARGPGEIPEAPAGPSLLDDRPAAASAEPLPAAGWRQALDSVVEAARSFHRANQHAILDQLLEFLAIPNVASDLPNIRRNAEWLVEALSQRGLEARLIEMGDDAPPYVLAERRVPGARRTVLFYCHYDGQAVDRSRWVGHDPWEPVVRDGNLADGARVVELPAGPVDPDWRIYARSASDDRAPIIMLLAALDALEAAGIAPGSNIKFLFEGDEEAGSPNMARLVRDHAAAVGADLVVIADGPKHPSGRPTLTFGFRGITTVQITVYGPRAPLHSGHYGNWAPNPALRLAQLLATMKDPDTGRVLIDGWYDDRVPLTDTELAALDTIPDDPAQSPAALGFASPEGAWQRRVEAITYPSLNIRGMRSAWVGDEARTVIPDVAIAELDLRLVKDVRAADQVARLIEHVRRQGFHVVTEDPDDATRARHARIAKVVSEESGYPAARTSMDLPISRAVRERLREAFGVEPVAFPTSGGSVPLYAFSDVLGIPTIGAPTVNHDNNQHSPNENLRIGNLWDGIEILAVLLTL